MNNDMTGKELQDFQTRNEPDATLKGEPTSLIVVRCFGVVDDTHIRTDEVYVRWEDVKKIRQALYDSLAKDSLKIVQAFREPLRADWHRLEEKWGIDAVFHMSEPDSVIMKMLQPDAEVTK